MLRPNLEIIIKENASFSTVGIRFEKDNDYVGDYEKFECAELTDEQIICAVHRLMAKLLPLVPRVEEPVMAEEPIKVVPKGESRYKFKRNEDGKFVLA